jgi:PAS domain S-box-containing protein
MFRGEAISMKRVHRPDMKNEETIYNSDFPDLFNHFPDMLFILDLNGDILMVNDTVTRRLEYAREELIGNSVLMVHPAERRAEAAQIGQRMIRDQEGHCPIPVLSKGGTLIPVVTRVVPGRWENRDVLFGVCRDITAVKLSEEKFSKTFHATAAVMALSTFDEDHQGPHEFLRAVRLRVKPGFLGEPVPGPSVLGAGLLPRGDILLP